MPMTKKIATLILGLLGSAAAFAAPPAAPQVTVGADTKELRFDWDIVPRSNYYEFWYKADNGAPWVKFGEQKPWQPHFVNHVGAHLFNWDQARYQVKACNPSGCTASAPIGVHDRMFESIGYFKPGGSYEQGLFASHAAISEDGQTIAAFADNEPVSGGFVSTLYIFARVNGVWQQQKRILPSTTMADRHNVRRKFRGRSSASLSADGNRLASSILVCTSQGTPCYQLLSVWIRNGTTWNREYQIVGDTPDNIGGPVQINEAGDRLWSGTQLFERTTTGWLQHASLPPTPAGLGCYPRLSGDGQTFAYACSSDSSIHVLIAKAPSWNVTRNLTLSLPPSSLTGGLSIDYAGTTVALGTLLNGDQPSDPDQEDRREPQVIVIKLANDAFSTTILRPESWTTSAGSRFGYQLALSRDASYLAVHDNFDGAPGRGVLNPPLQRAVNVYSTSATNLYELRATGPHLRRVIKPNNGHNNPGPWLAFANNGKTLLMTDSWDPSRATGINGDRDDESLFEAGALWLY